MEKDLWEKNDECTGVIALQFISFFFWFIFSMVCLSNSQISLDSVAYFSVGNGNHAIQIML